MAASVPTVAHSQDGQEEVDSNVIVVTAQRREQSVLDVPISVAIFDTEMIERQNLDEIGDYFDLTPNVAFVNEGSKLSNNVSIRGISNIGGTQNVVGFYVDEFNVAPVVENATFDQQLVDVARIEVLRGPQSTLFGRNASGGAISITTVKPSADFGGHVSAGYERFNTFRLSGAVNVPLSDTVFARFNGYVEDSAGFLKNEGPSSGTNDHTSYAFRGALRFQPDDRLTVDITGSHQHHEQGFLNSVPTGIQGDTLAALGFPIFTLDAGFFPDNRNTIQTDRNRDIDAETSIFTGRVQYDLDNFSIISVTGYIDHHSTTNGEADQSGLDLWNDESFADLESWSTELRLQSNETTGLNWMLGGVYAEDSSTRFQRRPFSIAFFRDLLGLPAAALPPAGTEITPINDLLTADVTSFGMFGEVSWTSPDSALTVSAGLRWQHDKVATSFFAERNAVFPPFTAVPQSQAGEASFDNFLPRFAANYEIADDINIYATVSRGGKPGGFNLATTTFPNLGLPSTFDSETLWNYEVGVKLASPDNRVRLDASLFLIDWTDIQVSSFFIDPATFASGTVTQNGAEATSKGIEVSLMVEPVDGLVLESSFGYQNSRFGSFPNAIIDSTGTTADASGNRLPLAPELSASVSAQYNHSFSSGSDAFLRLEYVFRDSLFTDNESRVAAPDFVDEYDYVNLRVGFDIGSFEMLAFVENVFDENYVTGYFTPNSITGVLATVNPRRYGISGTFRF
ncbi:TonB-dependent receptor [Parasphingorhabdus sp.]|uniref:TonB-dependent receptor n=1 Tax=Parasphingorhabdus sp. TaxID=2709688 RepID=UPI00326784C5